MNDLYLEHHGILGMKWGVRHDNYPLSASEHTASEKKAGYQKSIVGRVRDSIKKRSEQKKAMKAYDYRQSDKYKNASSREKATMTQVHNTSKKVFGDAAARKLDYKEHVLGLDRKKESMKEFAKQSATGVALIVAVTHGRQIAYKITKSYLKNRAAAQILSNTADLYGKMNGLNEVKGGFTMGFGHVKTGKEIAKILTGRMR